jgi:hypothetical protein
MGGIVIGKGDVSVHLLSKYGNRHGMVDGATGTGKSVKLLQQQQQRPPRCMISSGAASAVKAPSKWPVSPPSARSAPVSDGISCVACSAEFSAASAE